MIHLDCPNCGHGTRAGDELAGGSVPCPSCGAPVFVPPPEAVSAGRPRPVAAHAPRHAGAGRLWKGEGPAGLGPRAAVGAAALALAVGLAAAGVCWFVPGRSTAPSSVPLPLAGQGHDEAGAARVVEAYIEARSYRDRLAYVLDPDKVWPLMEEKNRGMLPPNFRSVTVQAVAPAAADYWLVKASFLDNFGRSFTSQYPVKDTPDGPRIDWEAMAGRNEKPLATYKAQRPPGPATFRLRCKISTYYNYDYAEAENTHLSVSMEDVFDGESFHGYVPKASPEGAKLLGLLKDGQPHDLIVEVRHQGPFGRPSENSNGVAILRLVSDSWVYK